MILHRSSANGAGRTTALEPEEDPELALDVGEQLLERARYVARTIKGRVRGVLRPPVPLRVLCVDDYPDAADALAAILELLGYESRACYDGPSALAAVEQFCPDACLLDLVMPGMDGLELAACLKKRTGPRPLLLIATTALGTLEDRTRTAVVGFHYHLVKPVDTPALLAALNRFAETTARSRLTPESLDPPED
ncbi:MAG TPA: response regulator [Gemmataceae bacterium]|nr:response regulator [Gemmataceae bacterium]